MKNYQLLVIVLCFVFSTKSYSQTCECIDCPVDILDVATVTSILDVSGLTNGTLNSGGQGICEVSLEYEHSWISDIEILLIAPDGSSIFLLADGSGASTSGSTWDITFLPCGDPVSPDAGANDVYTSGDFTSSSTYNGSYYPGIGCFSDLTGSANGEWTLQVNDLVGADIGEVTNWSITFCDGNGLDCSAAVCESDIGIFNNISQTFCDTDDPIEAALTVTGGNNTAAYATTWVMLSSIGGNTGEILDYSETADFTGYAAGEYYICAINYLIDDFPLFPATNAGNTNDDMNDLIDDGTICAEYGFACAQVFIEDCSCQAEAGNINISDLQYCEDDVIELNPTVNDENTDSDYGYTFTISNYESGSIGTLVDYSEDGDLTGIGAGSYWVCGLSYLVADVFILPEANGVNSNLDIQSLIDDGSLCAELGAGCYVIDIQSAVDAPVLDFESELCVGQASSVTVINYDPDILYGVQINSGSFSSLSTGTPTTTFTPGTDLDIEICVTAFSICGDEQTCANITVTGSSSNDIVIDGPTVLCPGNLVNYTVTGLGTSTIDQWTISGDATIVSSSTTDDNVDVQIDNVATTGIAELCIDIVDDCGETIQECIEITVVNNELTNNTEPVFCSLDFEVSVLIDGGDGVGVWSVSSAPVGILTFDDLNNSTTGVTVNDIGVGDYVLLFTYECNQSIEVPLTVTTPLETENVVVDCTGEMYTVSFDIIGGEAPYTVNGSVISGSSYTSPLIDDVPFSFTVGDDSDCDDIILTDVSGCECQSDAGTISPQDLLVSCEGESVTATNNGDEFLDADDIGIWILYTNASDPLGSILLENTTGEFSLIAPLDYMVTYFIAYIVGNDIGGTVDLDDPCIDIADGTSIIFSEPFGLTGITVDPLNSCGSEFELTAIQDSPIAGNWDITTTPAGGIGSISNINGLATTATLEGNGDFIITYSTADGLCSVSTDVTITGADVPSASVIATDCSDDNSTYTVSIDVQGGTAPYSANGIGFSGSVFFSPNITSGDSYNYTITDANGCEAEIITGSFFCDCESFAGNMSSDLIEICGEDAVTSLNDNTEILDGNDALTYILHTSSDINIGTILDENQTATFSFLPSMDYGTTYYISAAVADAIGSSVDFTDDCLSIASGQPVIWYETLSITSIDSDPEIGCEAFNLTVTSSTTAEGFWTVISSPDGSIVSLSSTTSQTTTANVDIIGSYTLQYEQIEGPCTTSEEISFIYTDAPSISNISYDCDDTNENYIISFDITGGTLPYNVNGVVSSANFVSDPIPNGLSIDYIVTDASSCESGAFTANFICDIECISDAGTMPLDTIFTCYDTTGIEPILQVVNNGNAILDGDDIGTYILHFGDQNTIVSPIAESANGTFHDLGIIPYNTTLYISYVVGNEVNNSVDLSDPCLSVSIGQPIIFYQNPQVSLGNDKSVCRLTTNITATIIPNSNISTEWNVISSPTNGNLSITENSDTDIDATANIPGIYLISISATNAICSSSDTVQVEFRETPIVDVMDDFSSCDLEIDLFSTKSGGSGIWFIPSLPMLVFDDISDTTTITLPSPGNYEIIRAVTQNNCTSADTLNVEIFPSSEFIVTDITCDDDNENYTISYQIIGDNYPYQINGQELNEGGEVILTQLSGEELEVIIIDNNLCEVANETFIENCDCESNLAINPQDLFRACIQDTLFIDPAANFTLAEGDSLLYIFHDSPTDVITNIIAVSDEPHFVFDPLTMSTVVPYFVSAVIYSGGIFDINALNEPCAQTDLRRLVFWYGPSETTIVDQEINLCQGDEVIVSINHTGDVPTIVGITSTTGVDFQIDITEEGTSEVVVPMIESGTVSISYVVPLLPCDNTFSGSATVNIFPSPSLELIDSIEVCNDSSEGNTTITLDNLIVSSSAVGVWTTETGTVVIADSFFDGTTPGDYTYTYTITDPLCGTVSQSTVVTVIDCIIEEDCPTEVILPLPEVCEGGSVVNLNDYVLPEFVDQGFWTLVEGGVTIVVEIPDITIGAQSTGAVDFFYTLPGLDEECDSIFFDSVIINETLSAGETINSINEYCEGSSEIISLFDFIQNNDLGGIWTSTDTDQYDSNTGVINLGNLVAGSYQFQYTVGANIESCPEDVVIVDIEIISGESAIFNTTDPLCFAGTDGSVEIFDAQGNIYSNDYQIFDADAVEVLDTDMLAAGAYTFTSQDQNGCDILSGFVLNDPLEIFLDLGVDIVLEEGETANINTSTNIADSDISLYEWLVNQSTIDAPSYENLTLNPDGESLVLLTITDDDGCIVADDILITLITEELPEVDVILANVFNANTTDFGVEPFSKIERVDGFYIYDRWGNNVFAATDFDPATNNMLWNGDYKGKDAMSGVYVYYLEYTDRSGNTQRLGGDVTLIR